MVRRFLVHLLISATILASGISGCADNVVADRQGRQQMPAKTIEETLKEHTHTLMAIPGVAGVAQSLLDGQHAIHVYVIENTPQVQQQIPKHLHGYPVVIVESGEFKALPKQR